MSTTHLVSLAAFGLALGCGATATHESPPTTQPATEPEAIAVSVHTVRAEQRSIWAAIDADATLAPSATAEVTTTIAGTLSALPVPPHAIVAERDVVATVTPDHGRATSLRALIDGEVSEPRFALGAHVDAHVPVLEITQSDPIVARFDVPEALYPQVHPGQVIDLSLSTHPDQVFQGFVSSVGAIDPSTHTGTIDATLPNAERMLTAGASGHVRIQLLEHANAIVVPREAVVTRDAHSFVFVAEGSVARERAVTEDLRDARGVEITSGLASGDAVLVPADTLHDGDAIQLAE